MKGKTAVAIASPTANATSSALPPTLGAFAASCQAQERTFGRGMQLPRLPGTSRRIKGGELVGRMGLQVRPDPQQVQSPQRTPAAQAEPWTWVSLPGPGSPLPAPASWYRA
jgi:hypothetical protein